MFRAEGGPFRARQKRGEKKILAERETRAIQNTHPKIQINHTHTPTHTKKGKEKYGPRPRAFAFSPLYNTSFPLQSNQLLDLIQNFVPKHCMGARNRAKIFLTLDSNFWKAIITPF